MSNRLRVVVDLLPTVDCLLDIGTDHGHLVAMALKVGKCQKAIATDIATKPLGVAKRNLANQPVSFKLSDGFKNVDEPFQAVCILGMGALTISSILLHAPKDLETDYLLQPTHDVVQLRVDLQKLDFQIMKEITLYDAHYYHILHVKRSAGIVNLTEREKWLGVNQTPNFDYSEWLAQREDYLLLISQNMKDVPLEIKTELMYIKEEIIRLGNL